MTVIVKSRESLLTTSSGYTNYRGILNLAIILLVLSNARAALENIIKYGILVDPLSWLAFLVEGSKHWPALVIVLNLSSHILISFLIELVIARQAKFLLTNGAKKIVCNAAIVANLLACISIPPIVIYAHDTHPISTSGSLMLASIVFLKLVSYHMMNFWCRDIKRHERLQSRTTAIFLRSYAPPAYEIGQLARSDKRPAQAKGDHLDERSPGSAPATPQPSPKAARGPSPLRHRADRNHTSPGDPQQVPEERRRDEQRRESAALEVLAKYPNNVTLADIGSFMLFPTLCYELEYARTERIRKRFLIKRLVELVILSQLDLALIQQWIVPTVSNSVTPFRQMQFSHMLERLLKLAIPNHVIWLIWFYLFFHSLLNIAAELTRFADREFYRDWWNSESVYYFWSNWNIPVHKWCARHLYLPLISLGLNRCQASTAVFFVSAFFHEYLVSVPLKMFRMWAFTGMLIQLPWARFVSSHFNNQFANVAVWVSLIIGQPLCILMYYHDYYVIHNVQPTIKVS